MTAAYVSLVPLYLFRPDYLAVLVTGAVCFSIVFWIVYRTPFGRAMRAVAERPEAAQILERPLHEDHRRACGGAERRLLDEPPAGMGESDVLRLLDDVRRLRERGTTIFLIEHRTHHAVQRSR